MDVEEREKERERGLNLRRQRLASPTAQVLVAQTRFKRIGFVTSFRAMFGLTRSIGGGRREKEGKETSGRGSQDEPAQDKEENGS